MDPYPGSSGSLDTDLAIAEKKLAFHEDAAGLLQKEIGDLKRQIAEEESKANAIGLPPTPPAAGGGAAASASNESQTSSPALPHWVPDISILLGC